MRYFIGFLITVGLIIWLIVLLFRGGGGDEPKVPETSKPLTSYATTDANVGLLIDGPIDAASVHQQVRITVDRNNVVYEELQGYDGNAIERHSFSNSQNAFDVFLHALAQAGFTQTSESQIQDVRGQCPLEQRYSFELNQGGQSIQNLWATSCEGAQTYGGSVEATLELFQAQVPNYEDLSENIEF